MMKFITNKNYLTMSDPIATRKLILEQAEQQFRRYGYTKTTIADIAKACAMSSANVYRFFASKGALVEGIAEIWLDEIETHAQEIAQRRLPASARFAAFLTEIHQHTIDRYLEETQVHELCSLAIDEHFNVVERHLKHMNQILEQILREGCEQGEFFVDDLPNTAKVVRTAMAKFHHPYLVAKAQQEMQKKPEQCLDCLANEKEVIAFFLDYLSRPKAV